MSPCRRGAFETLDQQFGKDSYLRRRVLTWRADDIDTRWRWQVVSHDRNERAGGHIFLGEAIGEISDAESRYRGGSERRAVVGLETSLRMNRDDLVAIRELPGFGALHQGLMGNELRRRLRSPMCFDIGRARNELPMDGSDASRDQVGVLQIAHPDRTIETLGDEIDETITVRSMNVELRVASRHFREHMSEMCRAESKRHSNPQAAAKVTSGQDRFLGRIDLGADSGRMVSKRDSGFCQGGAAGGSCKQLDAKFCFKLAEPPTDD